MTSAGGPILEKNFCSSFISTTRDNRNGWRRGWLSCKQPPGSLHDGLYGAGAICARQTDVPMAEPPRYQPPNDSALRILLVGQPVWYFFAK